MKEKHAILATFEDNRRKQITVYGTKEEITAHYVGNSFNLGGWEKDVQKCLKIRFFKPRKKKALTNINL